MTEATHTLVARTGGIGHNADIRDKTDLHVCPGKVRAGNRAVQHAVGEP